jgi:formate C-acetyltransferase
MKQKNGTKTIESRENKKLKFYKSVIICCEALINYAKAFADLADSYAGTEKDDSRQTELKEIARICEYLQIPPKPSMRQYKAFILYIWHYNSTLDYISLGRLDQTLDPYLQRDLKKGTISESKALELYECLLIKCAERMNTNP